MATMNISLPAQMKDWVEARVAKGTHSNASDYVRDLIRRDQERSEAIARLQFEIDKGRASGVSDKSVDEVFAEAREKAIAAVKDRDAAA